MGRLQRYRPQCLCAAGIESRRRTINRGARRRIIGAAAIGIALAFSGLSISRQGPNGQTAWRVSLVSPAYAEEDYVAVLIRVIEGATSSGATDSSQSNQGGNSAHLGMYTASDSGGQSGSSGVAMWGGAFDMTSSGWAEQDRIFPTVTKSPSVHDTFSYGGIYGIYDASRFVPANQSLSFFGTVDIAQDKLTFGPTPGTIMDSESNLFNLNILAGSVRWSIDNVYLKGAAMTLFGDGTQYSTIDSSVGRFTTDVYVVDATLGEIFDLYNTSGVTASSALPTKAPSRTINDDNGYMLGLDLSGHLGYLDGVLVSGFTDSAGLTWGNTETKFPMVGATAKLFATITGGQFQWKPYVSAAVDDYPGVAFVRTFPSQPFLPTGDVQNFMPGPTFWTGELGLDLKNDTGWTVGIKGFYMASSDTVIKYVGGYVKIPLDFAPRVASRY